MAGIDTGTFGLAIAFMAPGVVGLWGVGERLPVVREWFGATSQSQPTGAGFLFVVLVSFAVGLVISGIRQEVLDKLIFERVGIRRPDVDLSKLKDPNTLNALRFAVDSLYRYYQFYSNMLFAILLAYGMWLSHHWQWSSWRLEGFLLIAVAMTLLGLSARYSLTRYYGTMERIFE